jgi:hypothetical protein
MAVIRSYSRHVDGSAVEYQGTITAFSEPSKSDHTTLAHWGARVSV